MVSWDSVANMDTSGPPGSRFLCPLIFSGFEQSAMSILGAKLKQYVGHSVGNPKKKG